MARAIFLFRFNYVDEFSLVEYGMYFISQLDDIPVIE